MLLPWQSALAHADLEGQIALVTADIQKQPTNAVLFLRRAELHRIHVDVEKSLADFAEAARLAPDSVMPTLGRAQLFSDVGRFQEAINEANAVLKKDATLPDALVIRARCKVEQGDVRSAIPDLSAALDRYSSPQPDLFVERARLQAALGRLDEAVKGLDEGMAQIGAASALQMTAIEYERQQAKFDDALSRVGKIMEKYPLKEPWLVLRGEILAQAGRSAEAKATFQAVLDGLEKYPPTRRGLDQTKQLETRAREALARVEVKPAKPGKTE